MDMTEIDRLEKALAEKILYILKDQATIKEIKSIMMNPASNKFMAIADPARRVINLCNQALKD